MILTQRQLDVLSHVVEDAQAWAENASEINMLAKVANYGQKYDEAVAKGNYLDRKQRDDAEAKAGKDAYDNAPVSEKRRRSYPPIGDQLDALWKGGDDAAAMKVIIDKVKSDNPK